MLVAFRYEDWKAVFCEMKKPGGFAVWYEPFTCLRIPKIFNLRMDPYERADIVSDQYDDWRVKNAYLMGWMTFHAAEFLETFVDYPPSQTPGELHRRSDREGRRAQDPRDGQGREVGRCSDDNSSGDVQTHAGMSPRAAQVAGLGLRECSMSSPGLS